MNLTPKAKSVRRRAFERARRWVSRRETLDRTLVIIDMQNSFLYRPEEKDLIPVICELIRYARQQKWAIILVEYDDNGDIAEAIMEAVKDYPHQAVVIKSKNDGGEEIIKCITNKKTWSFDLLVCGIYGPQCVSQTVAGLFDHSDLVEVDIITDAVCPPYSSSSEENVHGQQREKEITTKEIGATAK